MRTGRVGYSSASAPRSKAGSAAEPAARCRNCLRANFTAMLHELEHLPNHNHIEQRPECLLLAQSGQANPSQQCPLSGVKRTLVKDAAMSAFDPKRT